MVEVQEVILARQVRLLFREISIVATNLLTRFADINGRVLARILIVLFANLPVGRISYQLFYIL